MRIDYSKKDSDREQTSPREPSPGAGAGERSGEVSKARAGGSGGAAEEHGERLPDGKLAEDLIAEPGEEGGAGRTKNAAAIRNYLTGTESSRDRRRAEKERARAAEKTRKTDSGKRLAGRTTKIILVLAAIALAMIPVYFALIRPLVKESTDTPGQKEELVPEEGEARTESGFLGMMPTVSREEVAELTISNKSGSWGFYYDEDGEDFFIRDHRNALYDTTTWTTIVYTMGSATFSSRAARGEDIALSDYGLSPEDSPAVCEITTKEGEHHTITVGNQTATGAGYYAMYAHEGERRPVVYIVSGTLGMCANLALYDLFNPALTLPLDEKDYVPERFDIYHEGVSFLKIRTLSEGEIIQSETAKNNHVFLPNGIEYNSSSTYMEMLYNTLRGGIQGTRVVLHAKDGENVTAAQLAEYNIHVPAYYDDLTSGEAVSAPPDPATMPHMVLSFSKSDLPQELLFSERTDDGKYYVYVALLDTIVEADASAVPFMEWDAKKFIDASIYLGSVYSVKDMTVDSTAVSDSYVAAGVPRVKETFRLTSKASTAADGSEIQVLTNVDVDSLGGPLPDPTDSKDDGPTNFKQLYMVLITIGVQLDVPEEVLSRLDMSAPDVTITIHTVRDQEHTLRFYLYNSRHAYYTLDGQGQFYVVYDELTKFLSDTVLAVKGRTVDYETNNNDLVQVDTQTGGASIPDVSSEGEAADEGMPSYFVVILAVIGALLLLGVGGFILYVIAKKKRGEK